MNAPGGMTERQIQRSILAMCGVCFPLPYVIIHHSPNGVFLGSAKDKAIRGGAMKGDGTKAGFADLICLFRGRGVLLEVKSPTGRLTDSQKALFPALEAVGWPVTVVRSAKEAFDALKAAGAPWSGVSWNG
jgi:hypothetical protein